MTPSVKYPAGKEFRYQLTRRVGLGEAVVVFIMLNPSTADAVHDDQTIRKCVRYANAWGYGWLQVVNLSPWRATYPSDLRRRGAESGEEWERNLQVIRSVIKPEQGERPLVVVAWGRKGDWENRHARMLQFLEDEGVAVWCLGHTRDGFPKHPLRLRSDTKLERYMARH